MAKKIDSGMRFLFNEGEVKNLMVTKAKELTARLEKLQSLDLEHRNAHKERDLENRIHKLEFLATYIDEKATSLLYEDLFSLGLLVYSR